MSAPATLASDGSVPFVDEPGGLREFDIPASVDPDPGDAKPCKAAQLIGVLPSWTRQGAGDNEPGRRPLPGLYGFAQVTSATGAACTLRGKAAVRLRIDGREAPVAYSDSVIDAAVRRVILVDQTHRADLRVDWSPPYCGPTGAQELLVTLPNGGGVMTIPVTKPTTPVCRAGGGDSGAELRTYVSASVFTPYFPSTLGRSPLRYLLANAEGVPTSARPGTLVRFRVRLRNPTSASIPLRPCPGFYLERFILGVDRVGFNTGQVYRLNCRPISSIPAGGSVVFQMQAAVPADPPGGPTFSVTWHLIAPGLAGEAGLRLYFALPLRA